MVEPQTSLTQHEQVTPKTRRKSTALPADHHWLSVPIHKDVHAHIHHQARLSSMTLKEYLSWFLLQGKPYIPTELNRSDG